MKESLAKSSYAETEKAPRNDRDYAKNTEVAEIGYDEPMAKSGSNHIRNISIQQLSSGYLVNVGCNSVAVETPEKLIKNLTAYITNPSKFERKWFENDSANKLED